MTPKEQAEKMVTHFAMTIDEMYRSDLPKRISKQKAKQCALIAVDEMIKHGTPNVRIGTEEQRFYWYNVKEEIKNL